VTATGVVAAAAAAAEVATGAESEREGGLGSPTIALAHAADAVDPGAWSGTPAGLEQGLAAAGVEVVRLGLNRPSSRNASCVSCACRGSTTAVSLSSSSRRIRTCSG
jgi:hypothetical protein